jgi:putative flippase GtrA
VALTYSQSLVRYFISGVSAVALHFLVLACLVEIAGLHSTIATTIGFVTGSLLNYTLQYYWAFAASTNHAQSLTRYALVTATTAGLNALLFWLLTQRLGVHYLASQALVTAVIFLINFEVNRRYTFS